MYRRHWFFSQNILKCFSLELFANILISESEKESSRETVYERSKVCWKIKLQIAIILQINHALPICFYGLDAEWECCWVDAESDFSYFMNRCYRCALESIIGGLRRLDESFHNCRIYCHYDRGGVSLIYCLAVQSPLFPMKSANQNMCHAHIGSDPSKF